MTKTAFQYEHQRVKKKTRQGAGKLSKGHKPYRGQGGPRKRCKKSKN